MKNGQEDCCEGEGKSKLIELEWDRVWDCNLLDQSIYHSINFIWKHQFYRHSYRSHCLIIPSYTFLAVLPHSLISVCPTCFFVLYSLLLSFILFNFLLLFLFFFFFFFFFIFSFSFSFSLLFLFYFFFFSSSSSFSFLPLLLFFLFFFSSFSFLLLISLWPPLHLLVHYFSFTIEHYKHWLTWTLPALPLLCLRLSLDAFFITNAVICFSISKSISFTRHESITTVTSGSVTEASATFVDTTIFNSPFRAVSKTDFWSSGERLPCLFIKLKLKLKLKLKI